MEILAPAGSFEALCAAVHSGADAVYVGGSRFSARKNAQNFSEEELESAVDFCHIRGVKLYLCCNTLMKEAELNSAMELIRHAYTIGVDALIIQDLGLLRRVRHELPDFPVHASTQMTIVNSEGVNRLAALGAERVVLARELSKAQIQEIKNNTETELEVFVHGALCISYSGQCLMSSMLGGRSGNRGACAQPCRLPYTLLRDGKAVTEKRALLCPKDLCLADRVAELAALGVTSLKIEGRMKSPEYVAMVTQVYKKAANGGVTEEEIQDMLKFFSRGGSCNGYFDGVSYGRMMDPEASDKISGNLPVLQKMEKRVPVSLSLYAQTGQPLRLVMTAADGTAVVQTGAICEKAHTTPTSAERMEQQLGKLGETPFYAQRIEISAAPDVAVAMKDINALRREGAEMLAAALAKAYKRQLPERAPLPAVHYKRENKAALVVSVQTGEQLEAALSLGIKRVYLPASLWAHAALVPEPVLQLPPLTCEGEGQPRQEAERVCIENLGQLSVGANRELTAGHRLNITNSETLHCLAQWGVRRAVLSPELNTKGILAVRQRAGMELEAICYGRLPLMLLANCVIKSAVGCACHAGKFSLRDRKNEIFPILPLHCGNEIYNAKPIYMADRMADLLTLGLDGLHLSFTVEEGALCRNIIRTYQRALAGETIPAPNFDFTRGHFYRGVQ